jgi:HSP20 family protein
MASPLREIFGGDMLAPSSQLLRMLDRQGALSPLSLHKPHQNIAPASSLRETDTAFQWAVTAPGLSPESINITIDKGVLRVQGESKMDRDGWVQHHSVDRAVQLPASVINVDGIEATHDNGLISITIPKKDNAPKPRRIPVRAGTPKAVRAGTTIEEPGPAQGG